MSRPVDHDAYIASASEPFRAILRTLHTQLSQALPDAEEVIAYDMPGFRLDGEIIAGYAAFTHQCGLYVDRAAIEAHADEIAAAGLRATKTGVTFSDHRPINDDLVRKLAVSSREAKGL